jgi:hypothetical protein
VTRQSQPWVLAQGATGEGGGTRADSEATPHSGVWRRKGGEGGARMKREVWDTVGEGIGARTNF